MRIFAIKLQTRQRLSGQWRRYRITTVAKQRRPGLKSPHIYKKGISFFMKDLAKFSLVLPKISGYATDLC